MKKKLVIFVIITIIIILSVMVFTINKTDNNNEKGYELFGNDYCSRNSKEHFYEDYEHPGIGGMAFTTYECEICNKEYKHSNTATPKICTTCATTTNRCQYCGKLENYKN